jgi:hypothetical protein
METVEHHLEIVDLTRERSVSPIQPTSKIVATSEQSSTDDNAAASSPSNKRDPNSFYPVSSIALADMADEMQLLEVQPENCELPDPLKELQISLRVPYRYWPQIKVFLNNHPLYKDVKFDRPEVRADDGMAEEALATARKHRNKGDLFEASCHFIASIKLYARSNNRPADLEVLNAHLALGATLESRRFSPKASFPSFKAGRFVILRFGTPGRPGTPALAIRGAFSEAEKICQNALAESASWSRAKSRVRCCFILGSLLGKLGNHRAMQLLLLSVLATSLREGWKDEIVEAMKSLSDVEFQRITWSKSHIIRRAEKLALNLSQRPDEDRIRDLPAGAVFELIKVAASYVGRLGDDGLGITEALLQSLSPHLGRLSSLSLGTQKAQAYLEYARFYLGQKRWGLCASSLQEAVRSVSANTGKSFPEVSNALKDIVQMTDQDLSMSLSNSFWTRLEQCCSDVNILTEEAEDPFESLGAEFYRILKALKVFTEMTLRQNEIMLEDHTSTNSNLPCAPTDDGTSMSSRSYKYGVTYSVSEITGVSDSIFMVP